MSPLSHTRTVPVGWSQHHVKAAQGGMNATVSIGEIVGTSYDEDNDRTDAVWSADYVGPARIQAVDQERIVDLAGQEITGQGYLVQIDFDAARLRPGMRVLVVTAVNDVRLVGDHLWLLGYEHGSERFTRDLACSDNQADVPAAEVL